VDIPLPLAVIHPDDASQVVLGDMRTLIADDFTASRAGSPLRSAKRI